MNTNQMQEDKDAVNQFLQLGRLLFQLRAQHPSMSETDILRMSRLMATAASGVFNKPSLIEKAPEEPSVAGKTGRKVKLSSLRPEDRRARILDALNGNKDGLRAVEIAKVLGLKGAQGLSPLLTSMLSAGLVKCRKGKKGQSVWTSVQTFMNGKTNGVHHVYAAN